MNKVVTDGTKVNKTEYLDGFQYKDGVLQFFPTTEGYVNAITAGTLAYNYVYNLTDHLGNVRVSYAWDDVNNKLKTVNEDHYYPFGLQHNGYNKPSKDITGGIGEVEIGIGLGTSSGSANYKYKYQGQERQEEFGLKWRNYDPAIGRFFNVDPLAQKYPHNSTYAFSENRVIDAVELEGLEAYILFGSEKRALTNFGQQYNGKSIKQGVEYGTNVYKTTASDGKTYYYYEEPNKGTAASVKLPSTFLNDGERVSTVHTHGEYLKKYDNTNFSPQDKANAEKRGVDNNVVTPDGSLKNYDVKTNKVTTLSTDMPSDPKDPGRKNNVAPSENPKPVETKPIEPKKVEIKTGGEIEYHHGRIM